MCLKKKQETLISLSVFVQQGGQITNSEEPLRELSMNEEKGFILEENGVRLCLCS
jgi:hypothetical protein